MDFSCYRNFFLDSSVPRILEYGVSVFTLFFYLRYRNATGPQKRRRKIQMITTLLLLWGIATIGVVVGAGIANNVVDELTPELVAEFRAQIYCNLSEDLVIPVLITFIVLFIITRRAQERQHLNGP